MNLTKFGSLHLDIPRFSYEFYEFVSIFGKSIKEKHKTVLNC
jgi:hypothetical protein